MRPPRSPLFPYTTLFRSVEAELRAQEVAAPAVRGPGRGDDRRAQQRRRRPARIRVGERRAAAPEVGAGDIRERLRRMAAGEPPARAGEREKARTRKVSDTGEAPEMPGAEAGALHQAPVQPPGVGDGPLEIEPEHRPRRRGVSKA